MTMLHEDTAGRLIASLPASDTYDPPAQGWTCFHCGERFTKVATARDHFGATPDRAPGCTLKVDLGAERGLLMALRKSEAELAQLYRERADDDTPMHRELYRLQAKHADALMTAEEAGYERGLRAAQSRACGRELSAAALAVLVERWRQIDVDGWTPEHDDQHSTGGMAYAAACYATADMPGCRKWINVIWEWTGWSRTAWWKPKDRRHNLVRAGALILAEIERLDRSTQR